MVTIIPPSDTRPQVSEPITIGLLVPISSAVESTPIHRSRWHWLRNRMRRRFDFWRWRAGADVHFHTSDWVDHSNTNRGDIAIRLAIRELLKHSFGQEVSFIEFAWDDWNSSGAVEMCKQMDLFVVGGGGYYFLNEHGELSPRIARDLALLRRLTCPIVALSPGINRLLGTDCTDPPIAPSAAQTLQALLDRLALSSERSESGRELLNTIRPGKTVTIVDPALFLMPSGPPQPVARDGRSLQVGINVAFHGPATSGEMHHRLDVIAEAARRLSATRPCDFHYFVHYEAERLIPRLLSGLGVRVRVVDAGPQKMLSEYASLDIHICQMLHSSILSLNAGVPTVNLSYDVKNCGFFNLMRLGQYCLPGRATDAAALNRVITELLGNCSAVRQHIVARKTELRGDLDSYLAKTAQLAINHALTSRIRTPDPQMDARPEGPRQHVC